MKVNYKAIIFISLMVLANSCCNLQIGENQMNEPEIILTDEILCDNSPSVQHIIFTKDSIIKSFRSGYSDIKREMRVDKKTKYNAFSVTKTFTTLAILQLAEKNKLTIDDKVFKYLPDFPYSKNITIRHLLSHTSGLPNPIPLSWIHLENEHQNFKRDLFFKKIFYENNEANSRPGEKFAYSNLGYIVLGKIIEKVSKISYENYVTENIINKLDVESNELGFSIDNKLATGYHKKWSFSNFVLGFLINKSKFMGSSIDNWKPFKKYYVNGAPYGGLIGTPNTFMKYIQELLKTNSKLISDEYKKLLFSEHFTSDNKPTAMCLSWFKGDLLGNEYYAHAGGGGGYYCEIRIYPKLGVGSVVMFNRTGMSDDRFLDKVDRFYIKKLAGNKNYK